MLIKGQYTEATIHTENIEQSAISQIYDICNHPIFKGSSVQIMPDVHAGKGCVVGFTAKLENAVIPNLIGVDIGCGMLTVELGNIEIDLQKLDRFISTNIPHGTDVNAKSQVSSTPFGEAIYKVCENIGDVDKFKRHILSVGSLGGGNHFVEINVDKEDNKYLVIHSGSRNFGHKIAQFYQKQAEASCSSIRNMHQANLNRYRGERKVETDVYTEGLQARIDRYHVPKELSFLEGELAENYIKDMRIAQWFATLSRYSMAKRIMATLDIKGLTTMFETVHNYIDEDNIIRKGAISAKQGEKVLIPINMRDGSILATGKGNPDWNNSAPHGAGRLMSRSGAKKVLSMEEFSTTMKDVYTTSVRMATLDEAPMAYKPINEILDNIHDTVDVIEVLKPIYNFKS